MTVPFVSPALLADPEPASGVTIDIDGRFLMPGLIDVHTQIHLVFKSGTPVAGTALEPALDIKGGSR